MDDRICFRFHGRLDVSSFRAFAVHRAGRLGLSLSMGDCNRTSCDMMVDGQAPLVDAFEMAMSLGPLDCVVLDVERLLMPTLEATV